MAVDFTSRLGKTDVSVDDAKCSSSRRHQRSISQHNQLFNSRYFIKWLLMLPETRSMLGSGGEKGAEGESGDSAGH